MNGAVAPLTGVKAKFRFATRKFHAWWEGYAFDEAAERAALQASLPLASGMTGRPVKDIVAETIWGAGRLGPGSPVWTMRYARMLSLAGKAKVTVLGAEGGGVLRDLEEGARWKATGLTDAVGFERSGLCHHDAAMQRLQKAETDGVLSYFQLSHDTNRAIFSAELLKPQAKAVFIDYAVIRKGARLPACFPSDFAGAPKTETDYRSILKSAGFVVEEIGDDTTAFLPLIERGWAGWRGAYEAISNVENSAMRADFLHAMSQQARLWAERYEALRSGQLRVIYMRAKRN
ncbi:MAG: hypothetical protein AAGD92_14740 [Pseudomonadota bacterium]